MDTWEAPNISLCTPLTFSLNPRINYFIGFSLCINIFLGLPANCYILLLSMKEMTRGQSNEIFVFNTALIEVIFCFSNVFVIQQYFLYCIIYEFGMFFLTLMLMVGRPLFQSCICVERYLGVLHPLIFLKLKPMKYRIACSAVGWIVILSLCATQSRHEDKLYNAILVEFIVFFTIKLYSCLMVLKALKRPGPGGEVKQKESVNHDKIKAFRIIQIVLVSSVFMYGPVIISLILYHIIHFERFRLCWSIAFSLVIMSGFVQPFLYLKRVGKLPFC